MRIHWEFASFLFSFTAFPPLKATKLLPTVLRLLKKRQQHVRLNEQHSIFSVLQKNISMPVCLFLKEKQPAGSNHKSHHCNVQCVITLV